MSPRRVAVALFLFAFGVALGVARAEAQAGRLFDGAGPPPVAARVRVARDLPPLEIRLLPPAGGAATAGAPAEPREIGRLEIARPGEPAAVQTIVVRGTGGAEPLARFTRLEDANFDGYADLLVASDVGARGISYQFYLFDPPSGSFVQDDLAREMSARLQGDSLELQRITGGIALRQKTAGCQTGFVWLERFVVEDGHLVKIEEQEQLQAPEGCYAVQRRRGPGGGLVEIARYLASELAAPN
jgi:hypothetical protein